jgi:hypothetical protein
MGRMKTTAVAALLLLAACASEHPAPYDCDVDPSIRPLGRKVIPFIAWVESRPAATADECSSRSAMFGEDMDRFMDYRRHEVDETGGNLGYLGNGLGAECGRRVDNMAEEFEIHGDRMREDAHCFWTRAWHALKQIE